MSGRREETIAIPVASVRRIAVGTLIVLALVAVLALAWQSRDRFADAFGTGLEPQIDPAAYQAVFLASGQLYFGHARMAGDDVLLLSDVYYLGGATEQNPRGQLIKRGAEVHAPREPMIIPVQQVLFIENLRPDSDVVSAIERFISGAQEQAPAPAQAPAPTPAPGSPLPTLTPRPTASPSPTATP